VELTEAIRNSIKEEIGNRLQGVYQEYMYPYNNISFSLFVDNIFKEVEGEICELIEINNDTIRLIRERINKTKKRWYKKELSEKGELYKEVEIIAKGLYNQLPSDEKDKFKIMYGVADYKELKKVRIAELKEWLQNNQIPVTHFRYINLKTQYQIQQAIINDIKFIILNTLMEKFPYGKQSAIMQMPELMGMIPYDYTNRVKINVANVVEKGYEKYFVDKYYIDDDKYFELSINMEVLQQDVTLSVLKVLNYRDAMVFSSVISRRDENFYSTREIIVDIGDITKEIFKSRGKNNYIAVKESLYKLQSVSSGVVDSSLSGFTIKIFDKVKIQQNVAKIIVSVDIVDEFIRHNTINMYKENINKFKLHSSKILIFRLQSERIKCDSETKEESPLFLKTNINFFRGSLYFSNKKRQDNIRMIENTLDEIVENKVTLKKYKRKGDMFILEFLPLTKQERKDLLYHEKI